MKAAAGHYKILKKKLEKARALQMKALDDKKKR